MSFNRNATSHSALTTPPGSEQQAWEGMGSAPACPSWTPAAGSAWPPHRWHVAQTTSAPAAPLPPPAAARHPFYLHKHKQLAFVRVAKTWRSDSSLVSPATACQHSVHSFKAQKYRIASFNKKKTVVMSVYATTYGIPQRWGWCRGAPAGSAAAGCWRAGRCRRWSSCAPLAPVAPPPASRRRPAHFPR